MADRHADAFFGIVHEADGNPMELLERMRTRRLVAIEMSVDEFFDQTPGPGAGGRLEV